MPKLKEDRRRKAPGDHLEKPIKVRVREGEYSELVGAAGISHKDNLTDYARDCMWIGHRIQQGCRQEKILAGILVQHGANALTRLFRGEQLEPEQLAAVLLELAREELANSFSGLKTA